MTDYEAPKAGKVASNFPVRALHFAFVGDKSPDFDGNRAEPQNLESYKSYAKAYLDMSSEALRMAKRFGDSPGGAIIADADANKKAFGALITSGGGNNRRCGYRGDGRNSRWSEPRHVRHG